MVYLFPVAIGVALWATNSWPFQRGRNIPARIPTVADGARNAYEALSADFRSKITEGGFAAMFERMVDAEDGAPRIRRASVVDAIGPEHARARFRVEYPEANAKAEYHFERLTDAWQLQSFTRVTGQDSLPVAPEPATPGPAELTPAPPTPAPDSTEPPAVGPSAVAPPAVAPAPQPTRGRRYHTIQAGDTLTSISRKYYGTIRAIPLLQEANPGLNPRRMPINRRIVIPRRPDSAAKGAGA
ncbi:MAG: LysM peptidoglycan-binding domain-containing protein [Candidatus Brocadiae bacterium]|nr:LysM peptidoglycan-binding domain-containing protein [Candidatus Brocadiia bacterium]